MVETQQTAPADSGVGTNSPDQDKPKVQLEMKSSPVVAVKTDNDHMDLLKKTVAQLENADGDSGSQAKDQEASGSKNTASAILEK